MYGGESFRSLGHRGVCLAFVCKLCTNATAVVYSSCVFFLFRVLVLLLPLLLLVRWWW